MIVSLIVALDEKGGIGKNNQLPWRLPDDLKRFKSLTMGHHVVMGRKTYESIGRLLPGRITIIITRNPGHLKDVCRSPECNLVNSLDKAIRLAESHDENETFIIGGGQIFEQALPIANRIYLTQVHIASDANVFFPSINWADWEEMDVSHHSRDEKHPHDFTFKTLNRIR